jgi:hypothetical protein
MYIPVIRMTTEEVNIISKNHTLFSLSWGRGHRKKRVKS